MAKSQTLTIRIWAPGLYDMLAEFKKLDKAASKELRKASLKLSKVLAVKVKAAALAKGQQAAAVAPTVKAVSDRAPAIVAGGTTPVTDAGTPAWALVFASEFGMNRRSGWYAHRMYNGENASQYWPHRGRVGNWAFPTVEAHQAEMMREWMLAAQGVVDEFTQGR